MFGPNRWAYVWRMMELRCSSPLPQGRKQFFAPYLLIAFSPRRTMSTNIGALQPRVPQRPKYKSRNLCSRWTRHVHHPALQSTLSDQPRVSGGSISLSRRLYLACYVSYLCPAVRGYATSKMLWARTKSSPPLRSSRSTSSALGC